MTEQFVSSRDVKASMCARIGLGQASLGLCLNFEDKLAKRAFVIVTLNAFERNARTRGSESLCGSYGGQTRHNIQEGLGFGVVVPEVERFTELS